MLEKNSKPTLYNGVWYDSKLEAKYAKAFDALGIKHEAKSRSYLDGRLEYTPDFYLPELDAVFEVKGLHWRRDVEQAKANIAIADNPKFFLGDSNGYLYWVGHDRMKKAKPVRCLSCYRWYISPFVFDESVGHMNICECWFECNNARYDERDNLFEAVGEKVYEHRRRFKTGDVHGDMSVGEDW